MSKKKRSRRSHVSELVDVEAVSSRDNSSDIEILASPARKKRKHKRTRSGPSNAPVELSDDDVPTNGGQSTATLLDETSPRPISHRSCSNIAGSSRNESPEHRRSLRKRRQSPVKAPKAKVIGRHQDDNVIGIFSDDEVVTQLPEPEDIADNGHDAAEVAPKEVNLENAAAGSQIAAQDPSPNAKRKGKGRATGWRDGNGNTQGSSSAVPSTGDANASLLVDGAVESTPPTQLDEAAESNDPEALRKEIESLKKELAFQKEVLSAHSKITATLQEAVNCSICMETMADALALQCGHCFCRKCLQDCFKDKSNAHPDDLDSDDEDPDRMEGRPARPVCPTCRDAVLEAPVPIFLVRQMTDIIRRQEGPGGLLYTGSGGHAEEEPASPDRTRTIHVHDPTWGGLFAAQHRGRQLPRIVRRGMRDDEDGVMRCMICNWEIEDGRCEQCGEVYDDFDPDFFSDDEYGYPLPPGERVDHSMLTEDEDGPDLSDLIVPDHESDSESDSDSTQGADLRVERRERRRQQAQARADAIQHLRLRQAEIEQAEIEADLEEERFDAALQDYEAHLQRQYDAATEYDDEFYGFSDPAPEASFDEEEGGSSPVGCPPFYDTHPLPDSDDSGTNYADDTEPDDGAVAYRHTATRQRQFSTDDSEEDTNLIQLADGGSVEPFPSRPRRRIATSDEDDEEEEEEEEEDREPPSAPRRRYSHPAGISIEAETDEEVLDSDEEREEHYQEGAGYLDTRIEREVGAWVAAEAGRATRQQYLDDQDALAMMEPTGYTDMEDEDEDVDEYGNPIDYDRVDGYEYGY